MNRQRQQQRGPSANMAQRNIHHESTWYTLITSDCLIKSLNDIYEHRKTCVTSSTFTQYFFFRRALYIIDKHKVAFRMKFFSSPLSVVTDLFVSECQTRRLRSWCCRCGMNLIAAALGSVYYLGILIIVSAARWVFSFRVPQPAVVVWLIKQKKNYKSWNPHLNHPIRIWSLKKFHGN